MNRRVLNRFFYDLWVHVVWNICRDRKLSKQVEKKMREKKSFVCLLKAWKDLSGSAAVSSSPASKLEFIFLLHTSSFDKQSFHTQPKNEFKQSSQFGEQITIPKTNEWTKNQIYIKDKQ